MNSLEFNTTKSGGISCKVNIKGKHVKTLFTKNTIPLLYELEEELFRDGFDISRINNSLVIDSDEDRLIFHDYDELRKILKKHTPYLFEEMDNYVESTNKRKITSARKSLIRAGILASIIVAGLNHGAIKLSPSTVDVKTVNAKEFDNLGSNYFAIPYLNSITDEKSDIQKEIKNAPYESEAPSSKMDSVVLSSNVKEFIVDMNCSEHSDDDEIVTIQDKYRELAEKIGNKWGVSPNLILGMLTQESHGEDINLMQIQPWSIADEVMTVYNFEKGIYQKIVVTSNPSKYGNDVMTISKDDLNNPYTNISVATALYRHILNTYASGNPIAAIEIYNKGIGNFNKNLRACSRNTGYSESELLSDFSNTSYLNYSGICGQGDPKYVYNIMQYVDGNIQIKMLDDNNQEYIIEYTINKTQEKELSR